MKQKFRIPSLLVWITCSAALIVVVFFVFMYCRNKPQQNNHQQVETSASAPVFRMITIPGSINNPADRTAYLATHYWDNFDFADTAYARQPQLTEQAFANYIEILLNTDRQTTYTSITLLLDQAQKQPDGVMYRYFCELFHNYLYNPNSMLRNDELYIPVVQYIINNKTTDDTAKERAKFQLEMMLKNRIGETATDFMYTLSSGKAASLHQLKSDYILLLFYNPDCYACETIITTIKTSRIIANCINNNKLTVLSVYPDADINSWRKHLTTIPANWINGYDKKMSIQNKQLYDLKAIPSVYLLDANKTVILKDTEIVFVEKFLEGIQ